MNVPIDVLNDFDTIESHIIEISTNDLGTDEIVIKIAVKQPSEAFLQELKDHLSKITSNTRN